MVRPFSLSRRKVDLSLKFFEKSTTKPNQKTLG